MNREKENNLKRKELYFTKSTIDSVSQRIMNEVACFANRHGDMTCQTAKTALLVLDMQEYFLSEKSHAFVPSSKTIIPRINKLIRHFERNNQPVIFSRHVDSQQDNMMSKWWHGTINKDDPLSEISGEIVSEKAVVFEKKYYDLFRETVVDRYLKERGIDTLIITGVMTHLCCETTARSAFMNDYHVFFPIDTTASYNLDFHRSSFINLSHGFAIPTLSKEIAQ